MTAGFRWTKLVVAALFLMPASALISGGKAVGTPPGFDFTPADRIVVVAPHPDDETLCCAGTMYRAVTRGAQVTVVWITSGDGSIIDLALASRWPLSADNYRQLGAERMREARSAAAVLGVPAANQTFLGFPDAALSSVVRSDARRPARSPYTKVAHVPYPDAWQPNAPYSAEALTQMLASLLDRANPTLLLAPCASDMHPDHAATAHLLQSALRERPQIHLACWMVHARSGWPTPRGLAPERALAPPATSEPLDWTSNVLSTAEREAKLKSIERYRTQRRSMESFLFSFVRTNELFASVAGP